MVKQILIVGILIFVFVLIVFFFKKSVNDNDKKSISNNSSKNQNLVTEESRENLQASDLKVNPLPAFILNKSKKYKAILATSVGNISVDLFSDKTPITVNNFVYLAKKNFYNRTIFHRVINGFMIQGGDPKGNGTGGPGYAFADEPFTGDYSKGTIAMANSGPNTNGSQFFIMHKDYPLPKNYVIFGKVVEGLEVVDKIASASVSADPVSGEMSKPLSPVVINSVEIVEQ